MMANATNAGSNLYSTEWSGPPATNYTLSGMSSALSALIAAIGPTPSENQTAYSASITHLCAVRELIYHPEHPAVPRGAVIGIAIAGAAVGCLMVAYIVTRAYRKRRQASLQLLDPLVAPFLSVSIVKTAGIEEYDSRLRRLQTTRRS
jgi:Na+/H+-translocating membrane pyrophosphatase